MKEGVLKNKTQKTVFFHF